MMNRKKKMVKREGGKEQQKPSAKKDKLFVTLGQVLKERRKELGLSQVDLGDAAGLHRSFISDVENGTRNLALMALSKLAMALDVEISHLMIEVEERIEKAWKDKTKRKDAGKEQ